MITAIWEVTTIVLQLEINDKELGARHLFGIQAF